MATTVVMYPTAVNHLLRGFDGPVVRDMYRRGRAVEAVAKSLVPRDTGALARDIHTEFFVRTVIGVRVGSNLGYARYVHDGTGLYGPRGAVIRPKRGQYLVFVPKGATDPVFAKAVRGIQPTPYLRDALPAALT